LNKGDIMALKNPEIKHVTKRLPSVPRNLCLDVVDDINNNTCEKTTEDINIELVSLDGMYLEYVYEKTPAICMVAVGKNPQAIKFVTNPKLKMLIELALGVEDV
jgi:hypothetical protein